MCLKRTGNGLKLYALCFLPWQRSSSPLGWQWSSKLARPVVYSDVSSELLTSKIEAKKTRTDSFADGKRTTYVPNTKRGFSIFEVWFRNRWNYVTSSGKRTCLNKHTLLIHWCEVNVRLSYWTFVPEAVFQTIPDEHNHWVSVKCLRLSQCPQ